MQCPSCHAGTLKPGTLEPNLPCSQCDACGGALLALVTYLHWSANVSPSPNTEPFAMDASDTKQALLCPKCSRLMVKYRITQAEDHRLDYCFGCEEVWLDAGEWEVLKSLGLHKSSAGF